MKKIDKFIEILQKSGINEIIERVYKEESAKLTEFLANNECDLNWGSGSSSIMGICYNEFSKKNRKIQGYTTPKYADDINNLPKAEHVIYEDTFDLKKNIFNDADMIVCLPGGTGTISEFFAYVEEIRSNDIDKPLVLFNL